MKINEMIRRLEEVREWAGDDVDVVIKEHNGMFNRRLDVGGDSRIWVDGEGGDEKVCVITSHVVLNKEVLR